MTGPYDQSYPPSIYGPPPVPPAPTGAVAGTPGHYVPAGAVVPATESEFLGLELLAVPLATWAVAEYVATGDGTHMSWTGSAWTEATTVAAAAADDWDDE